MRSQRLRLDKGWNAIYLEVDPVQPSPAVVFDGLPVDIVAAHSVGSRTAQFSSNPSADILRAHGWHAWYAPHRADAFLSMLFSLNGATSYLIHSLEEVSLEVVGTVPPRNVRWVPNAYNFVGFSVDDRGGPTFEQFFAGSPAHRLGKIYRLRNGTWRKVQDPAAEVMRSGEAFWIYTEGRSRYEGLLETSTFSTMGLMILPTKSSSVVLRNHAPHPLNVVVEHVVERNDNLDLSLRVRGLDSDRPRSMRTVDMPLDPGAWSHPLPVLEAGAGLRLPLTIAHESAPTGVRHSLLRFRTDMGTVSYVSVTWTNNDSPQN